jgi:hypothetical protein
MLDQRTKMLASTVQFSNNHPRPPAPPASTPHAGGPVRETGGPGTKTTPSGVASGPNSVPRPPPPPDTRSGEQRGRRSTFHPRDPPAHPRRGQRAEKRHGPPGPAPATNDGGPPRPAVEAP